MRSKSAWVLAIFVVMNVALLASNYALTSALKDMGRENVLGIAELLAKERAHLAAEGALLSDKVSALRETLHTLRNVRGSSSKENHDNVPESSTRDGTIANLAESENSDNEPFGRPDIGVIPLMSEAEKAVLRQRAAALPSLNEDVLLEGDSGIVLEDSDWNLTKRELTPQEHTQLGKLLKDYRFFAKESQVERYQTLVAPEVQRLRKAGAYVEYTAEEGPTSIEGIKITHAEADGSGVFKMYYFHPEDYPELYRHRTVSEERAQETFIAIYELLNNNQMRDP